MKMSLDWHSENLLNSTEHYKELKRKCDDLARHCERLLEENTFIEAQIRAAKEKRLTHFDANKFMKKRAK